MTIDSRQVQETVMLPGPQRYEGHRAIWMQQIDLAAFKLNWLLTQAFARGLTGVNLKDESDRLIEGPAERQSLGR